MTWEDFTDRYSGDGRIRLAAFHTKPAGHDMIDCQATSRSPTTCCHCTPPPPAPSAR